jgi:hypothetical protein
VPVSKVKITVTRTLSYTGSATWPDDYGNLTLAESVAHEQDNDYVSELLLEHGKLTTTVTSTELGEE